MKKAIFISNLLFIVASPLLADPADILTNQNIQDINDANVWCSTHTPEKHSMDGRRCTTLSSYAAYAKELAAQIPNSCKTEKVGR
jgi:hypothetical protein